MVIAYQGVVVPEAIRAAGIIADGRHEAQSTVEALLRDLPPHC